MTEALHNKTYPGESKEYRDARNDLLRAEIALRSQLAELAKLRSALPNGGAVKEDYVFVDVDSGKDAKLSELFSDGKDSLILYSFMYGPEMEAPCPSCTSFLDGSNAYVRHVSQRTNFVAVAKSAPERLLEWKKKRGWDKLRLVSSEKNTYNTDYFAETPEGNQIPALNVFRRTRNGIVHFWAAEMLYAKLDGHPRHVDLLWPIWSYFDILPEGRGDFLPKLTY